MDKLSNYLEQNGYIGMLFVKNLLDHPYVKEWKAANCTLKRNGQPPADSNRTTPPSEKEPEHHKEIFASDLIGDGDSCEPGPSVGIIISPETKPSTVGPIGAEKNLRTPVLHPGLPRRQTKAFTSPESLLDRGRLNTREIAPGFEEVGGTKSNDRRRCRGCYERLCKELGRGYAAARARRVRTRCIRCHCYFCVDCFNSKHKKCGK